MADSTNPAGKVVITPEALAQSANRFRAKLLTLPVLALGYALNYFTVRTGIRGSETTGTLDAGFELGPYDPYRVDRSNVNITGRTLQSYFGSVVKEFDPDSVYQSIYGSSIVKGDGLKNVPITVQVLSVMASKIGKSLLLHLFDAVRDASGTKTKDLFNGVDTVTAAEITAGNISADKGNLFEFSEAIDSTNAVDLITAFCRVASDELLECEDGEDSKADGLNLYVPRYVMYAYRDDYKATTGNSPIYDKFNQMVVEGFPNIRFVPFAGKAKSKFIQLSHRNNMLIATDQLGDKENILVEKYHPFVLSFIATLFWGFDYESIDSSRLLVGKFYEKPATPPASGGPGNQEAGK